MVPLVWRINSTQQYIYVFSSSVIAAYEDHHRDESRQKL